jgi:hypothetical protein
MNDRLASDKSWTSPSLLKQARAATDAVVEARGAGLQTALDSGRVAEIEGAFYDVFLEIYLRGYEDGISADTETVGASQKHD